jgi:glycosyl transferase family 25
MRTSIVVISLPDATDQRALFTARAAGTSLPWRWFDARRELGPELEHDPDEAIVAKGRPASWAAMPATTYPGPRS